jgi:thioredoxin reductase (NADPH)
MYKIYMIGILMAPGMIIAAGTKEVEHTKKAETTKEYAEQKTIAQNMVDLADVIKNTGETAMVAFDRLLHSESLVVVDFYASWCGPCKTFATTFKSVAAKTKSVFFVKLDIDKFKAIAAEYHVKSMPTVLLFKNGNKVTEKSGALSPAQFQDLINTSFGL